MRFLLRPGWLVFVALVVGFAVACYALLAPWQFGRERQREARERAIAAANATAPVPFAALVPAGAGIGPEVEWRQVTVTGTYLADAEALVRLRVADGRPAVEVLTPLRADDGRVVTVDRGTVPLTDALGVPAYPAAPAGTVSVVGRLRPDEVDPKGRPVVRDGGHVQLYATDSRVLGAETGLELVPGWVQLSPGQPGVLDPLGVSVDTGGAPFTNFSYALQWLTFGVIALVALGYFIRLEMLQRRGRDRGRDRAAIRRALAGDEPPPGGG